MASQKRGHGSNNYGDRNQHFNKKPRPNQPTYSTASFDHHNRNAPGKPQQRGNPVPQRGEDGPAEQLLLSAAEMQTGLVALLDRFVAAEMTPEADKDILMHARELRRLVSLRNNKSASTQSKRDLDQKRPDEAANVTIPEYIHRKVVAAKDLPPLPPITEPHIHDAVFTHKSVYVTNSTIHQGIDLGLDYERLEFLGDAYIELIASRALYNRFPHVEVPLLCFWRERLVENIALAKFSKAYGFPDRLKAKVDLDKETKAWMKVVADIFEAYVAGVVLSDPQHGFATAEKWLDELWAPQLLGFKEKVVENPHAREDLQKMVEMNGVRLKYQTEKPMTMDNGVQKFYLGLYMTGWGYENEWLGSGDGQNKAQACIAAAADALKRNSPALQSAARQKLERKEVNAKAAEQKVKLIAENGEGEGGSVDDADVESAKKRKSDSADEPAEKKSKKSKKDKKEKTEK
jgi:ribonuclease-3